MPESDKEIAMRLLDMIEQLLVQKNAREAVLEALHGEEWHRLVKKLEDRQDVKEVAYIKTASLRQQVLDAPDLTATVRAILESLERKPGEDETE
jgi:hypothetical protein